ncbi:hypothetical protein JWG39_12095 [Desulforhopalus vacuolatus]|uniref:hypothetical protein n=1 Tax=Desulforhopalus vacuolatus TaxID=40414 RepID=UPI0019663858|nr:hypothetical protein [Desulforhopalus vacuolatus]MBM9520557.1 hypothetical protein [Desulforhopalus vacuolatus]
MFAATSSLDLAVFFFAPPSSPVPRRNNAILQLYINGKAEESVTATIAELISERELATKSS